MENKDKLRRKKMMIAIYDILAENNFPTEKIGGLALRIIDLAKNNL
jgi:hypothetical protein